MNTDEKKQAWETPEIVDLDVRKTKSGPVEDTTESGYVFPASS
jgi:hypothetical protein